ncbi:MAG: hypothetical protein M3Y56_13565, partial [Armatimonadota bacterium]|nr:hypothetical protein [Armatimonadota bacterium]
MRQHSNKLSNRPRKMHPYKGVRNRSGQSIIEVLVAIALLVFGVFAVLRVFPIGFNMLRETGLQQQVQQLADSLAQEARNGQTQAPDGIVQRVYVTGSSNTPGWQIPNITTPAAVGMPVPPGT